jgi:hypothetical protein
MRPVKTLITVSALDLHKRQRIYTLAERILRCVPKCRGVLALVLAKDGDRAQRVRREHVRRRSHHPRGPILWPWSAEGVILEP